MLASTTTATTSKHQEQDDPKSQEALRALRLHAILNGSSHEGRTGLFFGNKLPLELLVSIFEHLEWQDIVRSTHVCCAWRKHLIAHAPLWSEFAVDLSSLKAVERVRVFTKRSQGMLRKLRLELNLNPGVLPVIALLHQILRDIAMYDGGKALRVLHLDVSAYHIASLPKAEIETAYTSISLVACFVSWAAVKLEELVVDSSLCRFPASTFVSALSNVRRFAVKCEAATMPHNIVLPDFFKRTNEEASQLNSVLAEEIVLIGISLPDNVFPSLPNLTSLYLAHTLVPNLYGLLSQCASTLLSLELHDVVSHAPFKQAGSLHASSRDAPEIIVFPALATLWISGCTAMLWESTISTMGGVGFMTGMPALREARFGDYCGPDDSHNWDADNDGGCFLFDYESTASKTLTGHALVTLLRSSPSLKLLDVSDSESVSTQDLTTALSYASSIEELDGSNTLTEDCLVKISSRTLPNLKQITLGCDEEEIGLPALKAFADSYRDRHSQLNTGQSDPGKLTIYHNSYRPAKFVTAEMLTELRGALATISSRQLQLLVQAISLPSDEWHRFRAELMHFGMGSKKLVGSAEMLKEVREKMQAWWEAKQNDEIVEWFKKADFVELM